MLQHRDLKISYFRLKLATSFKAGKELKKRQKDPQNILGTGCIEETNSNSTGYYRNVLDLGSGKKKQNIT